MERWTDPRQCHLRMEQERLSLGQRGTPSFIPILLN